MPRYIRVLKLEHHSEVWYVGPVRDDFQQATPDHELAVHIGHVLAGTLGVEMREETLAQVNAQRRDKDAVQSRFPLAVVLCAGLYLACTLALQVKTTRAIQELRAEVVTLHAELDRRVTQEQMRVWTGKLARDNDAALEVPEF